MEQKPIEHLIVDSSAFIKQAPLKDLTSKVYTIESVIEEIRDENTRRSLQVLPYEFKLKEPTDDALKYVTEFSKKTGDYGILSLVDMKLIALAYQLYKENFDEELSKELTNKIHLESLDKSKKFTVAGFYLPRDDGSKKESRSHAESVSECNQEQEREDIDENNNEEEKANEDDDDEGWVKPSNIEKIKEKLNADEIDLKDKFIKVSCMTTDYAMQNVLFQLGIPVVSLEGLLIKKIRNYVLECTTCFKLTYELTKQFCPKCGYKSLKRIIEVIDSSGSKKYFGRKTNTKGLRFPLPIPKGGKHSNFPKLSEDQPMAQNLPSKKALVKTDVLNADFLCQGSPFAMRDVYSRAARLGIRNKRK